MYEKFFGLSERPFELTVRPRFVFLTTGHREALSTLQYGVATRRALTLVLGEAGTGKTTLAYAAMDSHRGQNVTPVYLSNPTLSRAEFTEWLAAQFRLGPEAGASKTKLLAELQSALGERRGRGNTWMLMVDEAQSLPDELLEEIRLLTNLEFEEQKLLPVVLLGQPELGERLNHPRLRHLKQRVAVRCTLGPLNGRETAAYIAKRIRVAGGEGLTVFTREAVELVHVKAGGIPRTVNVICDNALLSAFAQGLRPVDVEVVEEVSADLDLQPVVPNEPAIPDVVAKPVNGTALVPLDRPAAESGNEGEPTVPVDRDLFATVATRRRRFLFF